MTWNVSHGSARKRRGEFAAADPRSDSNTGQARPALGLHLRVVDDVLPAGAGQHDVGQARSR